LPLSFIDDASIRKWVSAFYCLILLMLMLWLTRRFAKPGSTTRYAMYAIATRCGVALAFSLFVSLTER